MEDQLKDAVNAALKFLSYRARSGREVIEKLGKKGFPEPIIGAALNYLIDGGYINDKKFAEDFTASRIKGRNWGPARIGFELDSKGISREIIRAVLGDITAESETEAAKAAYLKWLKKKGLTPPLDRKDKAGAFRFLKGRGFSSSAASSAIGETISEE